MSDDLFIGWSTEAPAADRRFLVLAALGLVAAAGGVGAAFAGRDPGPQPARWDQGRQAPHAGLLVEAPYPTLLSPTSDGGFAPMLLVGYGKVALPRAGGGEVTLTASAIRRGDHAMLAVEDADGFARLPRAPARFAPPAEVDLGEASLFGEILDAKCWFGAMNPGFGLTHKACAALCARGGLPLGFCAIGACGGEAEELRLFLDEDGRPHGPALIPFLADPVFATGRLVRRNGLLEFRVARAAIRRV